MATTATGSGFDKLCAEELLCISSYLTKHEIFQLQKTAQGFANAQVLQVYQFLEPFSYEGIHGLSYGAVYVRKLAMSHWNSLEDFIWIQDNLPFLEDLDLSDILDYVTPEAENTYTWCELAPSCPSLWPRLKRLTVLNWAEARLHCLRARDADCLRQPRYSALSDAEWKQRNDLTADGNAISRRHTNWDGQFAILRKNPDFLREHHDPLAMEDLVTDSILAACTNVKALAIRGEYRLHMDINDRLSRRVRSDIADGDVQTPLMRLHRSCCHIADAIARHAPKSLQILEMHQSHPSLPSLVSMLEREGVHLAELKVGLQSWLRVFQPRKAISKNVTTRLDPLRQVQYFEEPALRKHWFRFEAQPRVRPFGENFPWCGQTHNHDMLGIINGPNALGRDEVGERVLTVKDMFAALKVIAENHPGLKISSHDELNDTILSLTSLNQSVYSIFDGDEIWRDEDEEEINHGADEWKSLLHWAKDTFEWSPIFSLNPIMDLRFPSFFRYDLFGEFMPDISTQRLAAFNKLRRTLRTLKAVGFRIKFIMGAGQDPHAGPSGDGFDIQTCTCVPNTMRYNGDLIGAKVCTPKPPCQNCARQLRRGPAYRVRTYAYRQGINDDEHDRQSSQLTTLRKQQGDEPITWLEDRYLRINIATLNSSFERADRYNCRIIHLIDELTISYEPAHMSDSLPEYVKEEEESLREWIDQNSGYVKSNLKKLVVKMDSRKMLESAVDIICKFGSAIKWGEKLEAGEWALIELDDVPLDFSYADSQIAAYLWSISMKERLIQLSTDSAGRDVVFHKIFFEEKEVERAEAEEDEEQGGDGDDDDDDEDDEDEDDEDYEDYDDEDYEDYDDYDDYDDDGDGGEGGNDEQDGNIDQEGANNDHDNSQEGNIEQEGDDEAEEDDDKVDDQFVKDEEEEDVTEDTWKQSAWRNPYE
ncbi:hypothetical protein NA57DRAFT_81828 [Rhizodiscina lignyota]|uniref:Uncharacterized protein n=1 Tax=Rhizodiscina lignyota TaxID=1504668 RepID=A0A9P4I6D4_9PEZI|nr:hypothetical protein NA57DRAFT_81828 [Rhizodiscina lignyota]